MAGFRTLVDDIQSRSLGTLAFTGLYGQDGARPAPVVVSSGRDGGVPWIGDRFLRYEYSAGSNPVPYTSTEISLAAYWSASSGDEFLHRAEWRLDASWDDSNIGNPGESGTHFHRYFGSNYDWMVNQTTEGSWTIQVSDPAPSQVGSTYYGAFPGTSIFRVARYHKKSTGVYREWWKVGGASVWTLRFDEVGNPFPMNFWYPMSNWGSGSGNFPGVISSAYLQTFELYSNVSLGLGQAIDAGTALSDNTATVSGGGSVYSKQSFLRKPGGGIIRVGKV